jgi:hypothetical protein
MCTYNIYIIIYYVYHVPSLFFKANKKDGKGVSNKYSQETTAVSVGGVPVPVEEASSSEDDEGQDNTFFFPIAIQQITTSMGPLSQNKRYSIR